MITFQHLIDYLMERTSDPIQKYIFVKEILKKPLDSPEYISSYNDMLQSKWYHEIANDQKEDGSFGCSFHGGNVKDQKGYKFTCTEAGVRRLCEMGLSKDAPVVAKCVDILEKYVRGEASEPITIEDWHGRDKELIRRKELELAITIKKALESSLLKDDLEITNYMARLEKFIRGETHPPVRIENELIHEKNVLDDGEKNVLDNGMIVANLNMLDPGNPYAKPVQQALADIYRRYFIDGVYDEEAHFEAENDGRMVIFHPRNAFSLMILRGADCIEESLERDILNYAWGKIPAKKMGQMKRNNRGEKIENAGDDIWYMSELPKYKKVLEEKDFIGWLSCLALFSGFSLFGEFMKEDAYPHLLNEAERLINGEVNLPTPRSGHVVTCGHETNGRYAENWRDKSKRKTDMILRIARILIKC